MSERGRVKSNRRDECSGRESDLTSSKKKGFEVKWRICGSIPELLPHTVGDLSCRHEQSQVQEDHPGWGR